MNGQVSRQLQAAVKLVMAIYCFMYASTLLNCTKSSFDLGRLWWRSFFGFLVDRWIVWLFAVVLRESGTVKPELTCPAVSHNHPSMPDMRLYLYAVIWTLPYCRLGWWRVINAILNLLLIRHLPVDCLSCICRVLALTGT